MQRTSVGLAVVMTFGHIACKSRPESSRGAPTAKAATVSELAREAGLTLPPSSRLLGVWRENGIDDLLMFKVELPRLDLASFLATCPVPADAFEEGSAGFLGPDQGLWDPSKAAHLRTGQIVRDSSATNVGIDDGRPDGVILYIVNHGT